MPNPKGDSMVTKKSNFRTQGKIIGAITILVCLLLLSGTAYATAIYDNLSSTYSGYDDLTGWGPPLYDSFSVGANGFKLLDVQLMLRGTPSTGSLSVAIYSDSSTSPGTLLFTIGTLSDNDLPSSFAVVDFLLASPYGLTANTRYWLVLDSNDNSTAEWSWSSDQTALGVSGEYFGSLDENGVYSNSITYIDPVSKEEVQGGPYQMRLSDTPLPPSLLLLGSGLAGLGLLRFRKRFKA
jgi:hypothetical protein